MNKKGIASELRYIIIIFVVTFIALVVYFSVTSFLSRKIEVDNLQGYVVNNRILFSKDCLLYEDSRVYPGIIDINKFNEQNLGNCINYNENIGYLLTLKDSDNNEIKRLEINNEDLTKKIPFCAIKNKNFNCDFNTYYILYYDQGIKEGILNVAVVTQNE